MSRATFVDWSDVDAAAKEMAGNWREFESFAWHRAYDLDDSGNWALVYMSNSDSGLLAQSNEQAITKMLDKFTEDQDPDVVFESHYHWACGHIDGFSVRVYRADGSITDAFREVCRIQERLEDYPLLDEEDYSQREYEATLANYAGEIGHYRSDLEDGWESTVYQHFSDIGEHRLIENRDDQGGWCPREKLVEALIDLGMLESEDE
jgi:hypothetical protein